jgi:hypothetical protein
VRKSTKSLSTHFPFKLKQNPTPNCNSEHPPPHHYSFLLNHGAFLPGENALHFHFHSTISQQEENCIGYLETFQEGKQMMAERETERGKLLQEEKI